MKWNNQQENALKCVDNWFYTESKNKKIFRVFGYAGTGKSTLARHFADNIDGQVSYAAFTGKAASVMRKAGCVNAKTIHSLIYKTQEDDKGRITFHLNRSSELSNSSLLIVDECSMVDEHIGKDLLSFGVPILVLGDPAQLPPPNGSGFFTEHEPDIMLTEIHRQASDNPIIHLATLVREGNKLSIGKYGESEIVSKIRRNDLLESCQVIVGRNSTRKTKNNQMRQLKFNEETDLPVKGDKLICLKNDSALGIYNGMMFNVDGINQHKSSAKSKYMFMSLDGEDFNRPIIVKAPKVIFTSEEIPPSNLAEMKKSQHFDYGYAITAHKSQGSQWESVLIYDESWCFRNDWNRWLYTSITRASEKVKVLQT